MKIAPQQREDNWSRRAVIDVLKRQQVGKAIAAAATALVLLSGILSSRASAEGAAFNAYFPLLFNNCHPIYIDNFEDPASGWEETDNLYYQAVYALGEYYLSSAFINVYEFNPLQIKSSEMYVLTEAHNEGSGDWGFWGIQLKNTNWFTFGIGIQQKYYLYEGNVLLDSGFSDKIQAFGNNQIKVLVENDQLTGYVNGATLTSLQTPDLAGELESGVAIIRWNPPGDMAGPVYFNNFGIYDTSCDPASNE